MKTETSKTLVLVFCILSMVGKLISAVASFCAGSYSVGVGIIFTIFLVLDIIFTIFALKDFEAGQKQIWVGVLVLIFSNLLSGIFYLVWNDTPTIHNGETISTQPITSPAAENNEAKPSEKEKIEALREYKRLLDEGVLTQAEFDAKKAEILK